MKYEFVKINRSTFSVRKMCQVLKISQSGYYKRDKKQPIRDKKNNILLNKIKIIYEENKGCYGSPRITKQLNKEGSCYGKNRIARIMQKNNIRAKTKKKFKITTTNSNHKYPVAPNILNQNFRVRELNQVWVSDITYIYTCEGWLYLSAILDLCSKKIIGWSMDKRITKELTIKAFQHAVISRDIKSGIILHSDRGSQYASYDYANLLVKNKFIQSMSGKGNCYDNAVMESFFKTLKSELVYWEKYTTIDDAKKSIFEYIEMYYNRKRIHSSIGYMNPEEFERSISFS